MCFILLGIIGWTLCGQAWQVYSPYLTWYWCVKVALSSISVVGSSLALRLYKPPRVVREWVKCSSWNGCRYLCARLSYLVNSRGSAWEHIFFSLVKSDFTDQLFDLFSSLLLVRLSIKIIFEINFKFLFMRNPVAELRSAIGLPSVSAMHFVQLIANWR